jgi:hypothetical protein
MYVCVCVCVKVRNTDGGTAFLVDRMGFSVSLCARLEWVAFLQTNAFRLVGLVLACFLGGLGVLMTVLTRVCSCILLHRVVILSARSSDCFRCIGWVVWHSGLGAMCKCLRRLLTSTRPCWRAYVR